MHANHPGKKAAQANTVRIHEAEHFSSHAELMPAQFDSRAMKNFVRKFF
jgi:hypothetical protein